jgi:hypothetical protein
MPFWIPKEPPKQGSRKERCSLSGAFQLSLKFPVNGLPRFPPIPYRERHPSPELSSTTFPQSPWQMSPPPCSPTGSLWRNKLHLQRQWFIHSFISVRVPNKEPSHEKRGKYLVTVHGAPRGRKACIQWGAAWFSKGIVYDTAVSNPVPCRLQHDTFHFGLG